MYICILFFIYQFQLKKYKDTTYYRESKFLEHSPIVWYYLLNKKVNKTAIIATLLYYLKQGYISMEVISDNSNKDYEFKIIRDIDSLPKSDHACIKAFFNKTLKINLIRKLSDFNKMILCEKTFGDIKDVYQPIIEVLRQQLSSQNKIKQISKRLNFINVVICVIAVISINLLKISGFIVVDIFIMLLGISFFNEFCKRDSKLIGITYGIIFPLFCLSMTGVSYFIPIVLTHLACILLVYIDDLMFKRINSDNLESKANGLKNYIKAFGKFEDKPLEQIAIWNEFYVYAVVFGVKKI